MGKYDGPPHYGPSNLPEPKSFVDKEVIFIDLQGVRTLLFSDGLTWKSSSGNGLGGGASVFNELNDYASANLPGINTPLAQALQGKASTASVAALTIALDGKANATNFSASAAGLVPASGGGTTLFLRADGTFAAPPGGGGGSNILVTISGTFTVGSTLTATPAAGYTGTYQWTRNGANIAGATGNTYVLINADSSNTIGVKFTATAYVAPGSLATGGTTIDTRPRYGLGAANAYTTPASLLAGMIALTGSSNNGAAGTFSLTTTSGNFGWLAIVAAASASGVHVFDGVGYGGWSGAGLAGNNSGASPDPTTSTTTYTDGDGTVWRLFRQDYINANPTAATYTLS